MEDKRLVTCVRCKRRFKGTSLDLVCPPCAEAWKAERKVLDGLEKEHRKAEKPLGESEEGWVLKEYIKEGNVALRGPFWTPISGRFAPCVRCRAPSDTVVCSRCRRRQRVIASALQIAVVVAFVAFGVGLWLGRASGASPKKLSWGLWMQYARKMEEEGDDSEAEICYEIALERAIQDHGDGSPEAAIGYWAFASYLHDKGKVTEAEHLYVEAIRLLMEEPWAGQAIDPHALGSLAIIYAEAYEFARAERYYVAGRDALTEQRGPGHPDVLQLTEDYETAVQRARQRSETPEGAAKHRR